MAKHKRLKHSINPPTLPRPVLPLHSRQLESTFTPSPSFTLTPEDAKAESYIDTLADDIFSKIGGKQLDAHMIQKLSGSLPSLLKALALNIGYQNQTRAQRDLMVFIHKQSEQKSSELTVPLSEQLRGPSEVIIIMAKI
ncbi:hypothetical protein F4823DRAFT_253646 [Ustulina deusta]|nr:hypothetical protein F4823DRAFT_253646 [Ustulina deusta]